MASKRKMLYFSDAADDCYTLPAENLIIMKNASSTTLNLLFHPGSLGTNDTAADIVTLTIADASEKTVIKAITNAIADPYGDALIVVCDLENSVYLNTNITSTAYTIAS